MNSRHPQSPLPDWQVVKDFTDVETSIAVRISKRTMPAAYEGAVPVSHFSFEIGRMTIGPNQTVRVQRHFQAQCLVEHGRAHVVPFPCEVLNGLIHRAEEWIQGERQTREDAVMENRINKERAQIGARESVRGLKTLAKEDKAKRLDKE